MHMVSRRGFSIVELLIGIAVLAILIVAVTMLSGRFFTVSREQFEQTRTTEDARIQLERMTDVIRNARTIDCDGNDKADKPQEGWLQTADPARMVFYSNIDADAVPERVTYEQTGNDLRRTVDQDTPTPCSFNPGSPQVMARSLHNTTAQPVFSYIAGDGTTMTAPITLSQVVRVRAQLIIDAEGRNLSNATQIVTDITPRLGREIAAIPIPVVTPSPVPSPSRTPTPSPSLRPTPSPGRLTLFINSSVFKPAPEQSETGPVWLDLGEQWGVSLEYDAGGGKVRLFPNDPDLSFVSKNTGIATVENPPNGGRLFGKAVGDANIKATYRGETLTFQVEVRDGCWRNTNGGWAPTLSYPQPISQICTNAGYSARALCGRTCLNVPQPGSDAHLQNLTPGSGFIIPAAPSAYGCGAIYPGGGQQFQQLLCSR